MSAVDLFYMLKDNPQELARKLMHLPIKQFFNHGVKFRFLLNSAIALGVVLLVQLRVSMRARQWAKSFLIGLVCGGTSLGILFLGVLAFFKYKIQREKQSNALTKLVRTKPPKRNQLL
jgi:hypothetical protein